MTSVGRSEGKGGKHRNKQVGSRRAGRVSAPFLSTPSNPSTRPASSHSHPTPNHPRSHAPGVIRPASIAVLQTTLRKSSAEIPHVFLSTLDPRRWPCDEGKPHVPPGCWRAVHFSLPRWKLGQKRSFWLVGVLRSSCRRRSKLVLSVWQHD